MLQIVIAVNKIFVANCFVQTESGRFPINFKKRKELIEIIKALLQFDRKGHFLLTSIGHSSEIELNSTKFCLIKKQIKYDLYSVNSKRLMITTGLKSNSRHTSAISVAFRFVRPKVLHSFSSQARIILAQRSNHFGCCSAFIEFNYKLSNHTKIKMSIYEC